MLTTACPWSLFLKKWSTIHGPLFFLQDFFIFIIIIIITIYLMLNTSQYGGYYMYRQASLNLQPLNDIYRV